MALSDQIEKAARTHRLGSDDDRSAAAIATEPLSTTVEGVDELIAARDRTGRAHRGGAGLPQPPAVAEADRAARRRDHR
jgi:hypothetical protein